MSDCPHYSTRIASRQRSTKTLSCDNCPEVWTVKHPIHQMVYNIKNLVAGLLAAMVLLGAFIVSSAKASASSVYPPPAPSTGSVTHPVPSITHHVINHVHHLANTGFDSQGFIALAIVLLLVGGGALLVGYGRKRSH